MSSPCFLSRGVVVRFTIHPLYGLHVWACLPCLHHSPKGVVFVAAIDCYNRNVNEGWLGGYDETVAKTNALVDSIDLFGGIANQCLGGNNPVPLILLLNKVRLFVVNVT